MLFMGLKHWVGVGLVALLAACASKGPEHKPEEKKDIISQLLEVPSLEQMTVTAARPLKGRFQAVTWGALPGWQEDVLTTVWQGWFNNCKGLMRPISVDLNHLAVATPIDRQRFCV